MLDLDRLDLEEIASALADQGAVFEHQWLINPESGELVFWTSDTGIDGQNPIELDELDELGLIHIGPLPSYIWYRDMVDFIDLLSDERAARRLARAIQGKGAFRRFKDELNEEHPELLVVRVPRRPRTTSCRRLARRQLFDRRRPGRSPSRGESRPRRALTDTATAFDYGASLVRRWPGCLDRRWPCGSSRWSLPVPVTITA